MRSLKIVLIGTALAVSTPAFAYCDPADPNYRVCLYNEDMHAGGLNPPSSVSSRPNPIGGYDYSNGLSSRPNPLGGYDYSNGVGCRPNPLGSMDCSR
jgi:hypothetical protein